MGQYKEQWILLLQRVLNLNRAGDNEQKQMARKFLIEMASVESAIGGGKKNGGK